MSKDLGIEEQVLYVYAAIQHLQRGRSTVDIAEELGVSRFMVGRMIKRARSERLVELVTRLPQPIDTELSKKLARTYGLQSAIVATPPRNSEEESRTAIAAVAACLVADLIDEDDIVGLGPGRTIVQTCDRIAELPSCDVVQLTGVAASDPDAQSQAIMHLSRAAKGRMFPLHAPFVATDRASTRVIASQPAVRQALQRMDNLDKAVLTVGGWPHSSLLATQLADLGELDALLQQGVVAEIGTTLLDANGRELTTLEGRIIGVSTEQLAKVPVCIALGGGLDKQQAAVAVLKSGLLDIFVTDVQTAQAAIKAR